MKNNIEFNINDLENFEIISDDKERIIKIIEAGANIPGFITTSSYDFKVWLNNSGKWNAKIFNGYSDELLNYCKDANRLFFVILVGKNHTLYEIEDVIEKIVDRDKQEFNFSLPCDESNDNNFEICILKK